MKKDCYLELSDGEKLQITIYGAENIGKKPCIIYVHGFKGFKDWGWGEYLGDYISKKDYMVITFNFSHNGIGDNPLEFTELEKFANNTLSREIHELSDLIDAYCAGLFGESNNQPLGIIGHSRGGGIAILTTYLKQEVSALTSWSAVSTFDRYSEEHKQKWHEKGYLEVINARTKQVMRLNASLLDDLEKNKEDRLNIQKAIKSLRRPCLIIHGQEDEAVSLSEANNLNDWADPNNTKLITIPSTGHTFGAAHPFVGTNPKLEDVLKQTTNFFDKHLK